MLNRLIDQINMLFKLTYFIIKKSFIILFSNSCNFYFSIFIYNANYFTSFCFCSFISVITMEEKEKMKEERPKKVKYTNKKK
jgi:hypothetical protein